MIMPHEIDLAIEDARWETAIPGLEALVTRAVEAGLAVAPETPDGPVEVSVLLTDDAGFAGVRTRLARTERSE